MPETTSPIAVCADSLPALSRIMATPRYKRSALRPGIVHIGVGGFNRAHQAVYLDDLLSAPDASLASAALDWGEWGVGLLSGDQRMSEVLHAQDLLYTLVERSAHARTARVIGSLCGYTYAPGEPAAVLAIMGSAACRIVSMTVTEAGYFLDQGTGSFQADHLDLRFDLENPDSPRTFVGYICQALDQRRRAGLQPFSVLSCDNLQGNGDVSRRVVLSFAELKNPALRQWIEQNVSFPNSMVDRITPATTEVERRAIEQRFGILDGWPVITEPFRQWVIEDTFCNGRPAFERVGVLMTHNVEPFEAMKMRLLNGSHFAMAYLGAMLDFEFVHECLEDALMRRFIRAYMEAVSPTVHAVPGVDLTEYKATLLERFANPTIRDQISRICAGGSSKLPKFVLPVYLDLLQAKRDTRLLGLVVASWLFYFQGRGEKGQALSMSDPCAAQLAKLVHDNGSDPRAALALNSIFGEVLPSMPQFITDVATAMQSFGELGVAGTLARYVG